jgi:hypothetical protein
VLAGHPAVACPGKVRAADASRRLAPPMRAVRDTIGGRSGRPLELRVAVGLGWTCRFGGVVAEAVLEQGERTLVEPADVGGEPGGEGVGGGGERLLSQRDRGRVR